MSEKSKSSIQVQKKTLIIIACSLLVISVLALIGNKWRGQINEYKKKVAYSDLRAHELEQKVKELQVSQNPSEGTSYLEIKELGIKIELSNNIKDAYYILEQIPSPSGPLVHISTQTAKSLSSECAADRTSLLTLSNSDLTSYRNQVEYGVSNIRKIGEKYIHVSDQIGSCWQADSESSPTNQSSTDQITSISDSLFFADMLPIN